MKRLLFWLILTSIMALSAITAESIKPSLRVDTAGIESEYDNVSFKKIKGIGGTNLLIVDIAPTQNAKDVAILICYPDSGNVHKWLGYGLTLADMGYRVVMFDYRGFGGSSQFSISPNALYYDEFIDDARSAYTYMAATYPKYKKGLFGLSMGSIMTTELALELKGDFIIGDSYVADIDTTAVKANKIFCRNLDLPSSSGDYNRDISTLHIPMLLFSGKYDAICTTDSLANLASSEPKIIVYNGSHLEGPTALKMEYFRKIDQFIEQTLASKETTWTSVMAYLYIPLLLLMFLFSAIKISTRI